MDDSVLSGPIRRIDSPARRHAAAADRPGGVAIAAWLIAAGVAPFSLLVFNRDWFMTYQSYIDAWHYIGFFQYYDQPHYWPGHYKLARLPWVLLGYGIHRLAPPVIAAFVLHGLMLVGMATSMFGAAYIMSRNLLASFVVGTVFGFFVFAHGSGGWDYHNSLAVIAYLATLILLQVATEARPRRTGIELAIGSAFAIALHSNITYINLLPVLMIHRIILDRGPTAGRRDWFAFLRAGMFGATGFMAVTLALSGVNYWVGRDPWFFWALIRIVLRYTADSAQQASWWHPWSSLWFLRAPHLALPAAVVTMSVVTLGIFAFRGHVGGPRRLVRAVVLAECVAVYTMWVIWQSLGQTALDWPYFAFPIAPHCFLALAAMLGAENGDEKRWARVITMVVGGVAPWYMLSFGAGGFVRSVVRFAAGFEVAAATIEYTVALAIAMMLRRYAGAAIFIGVFAIINAEVGIGRNLYAAHPHCAHYVDAYDLVVEASRTLAARDPAFQRTRIWFEEKESVEFRPSCRMRVDYLAKAIFTTGFGTTGPPWPMRPAASLSSTIVEDIAARHDLVVAITGRPENVDALQARFTALGVELHRVRMTRLSRGDLAVDLYFLEARPSRESLTTYRDVRMVQAFRGDAAALSVHGGWSREQILTVARGRVTFNPRRGSEYVTLPFVPIGPTDRSSGDRARRRTIRLRLSCDAQSRSAIPARIILQDQNYTFLSSMGCYPGDDEAMEGIIPLKSDSTAIRLVVAGHPGTSAVLPQAIEAIEVVRTTDRLRQ
jgi:hypothetical protein